LAVGGRSERIVGLFRTDQALADTGAMFPLSVLQNWKRQAGEVTLVFIQLKPGVNVQQFRQRLETDEPQLTTVMTMSDFGRADRSMQLINAADQGSRLLAVLVGALIVMSMMTMAFIERIREFGVLSAVGWPPRRVMGLVLAEAGALGVLGAAAGVGLSVAAAQAVPHLASVSGILQIQFTTDAVWRALYTAAGMTLLGAAYPAARAALLSPLEALRHE
jgi:putative ABC transport system permease protein